VLTSEALINPPGAADVKLIALFEAQEALCPEQVVVPVP
jgi:hypothetical protein